MYEKFFKQLRIGMRISTIVAILLAFIFLYNNIMVIVCFAISYILSQIVVYYIIKNILTRGNK